MSGFLFSSGFFGLLMLFDDVIDVLEPCHSLCAVLVCLSKAVLVMTDLSVYKAAVVSNELVLGLEGLLYVFCRDYAAEFFSVFLVYNRVDPMIDHSLERELPMVLFARNIHVICIELEDLCRLLFQIHPVDVFKMTSKRVENHQLLLKRPALVFALGILV